MHLQYWGLENPPFVSRVSVESFYEASTHAEALARLHYLVKQNRRLGLLIGTAGTGKSLILELLARQMRRSGCFVSKVNVLGLDREDFLWQFSTTLGCQVTPETNPVGVWKSIQDRMATLRYQRIPTVVLIDDADECESEVITILNRIAQMEQLPDSALSIVLACNDSRVDLLGHRLLELCELPIELESLEPHETTEYVRQALERAGRTEPVFDDSGYEMLHVFSRGTPRAVNQLADLCLVAGAAEEVSIIDSSIVESVQEAFGESSFVGVV